MHGLLPYFVVLIRKWKILALHVFLAGALAVVVAFFLMEKMYSSSVTFLPPADGGSALSGLMPGIGLPSFSPSDIMPEQIASIFYSKTLKREIIEKYGLYECFDLTDDPNRFEIAARKLDEVLELTTVDVGTIGFSKTVSFSISMLHRSPDTAYYIVEEAFALVDSSVRSVSANRAHRHRVFIEEQLRKTQSTLDSLNEGFKRFKTEHKAFDVPEQLKSSIRTYAELKSLEMANTLRLKALRKTYKSTTPEIRSLEEQQRIYQQELDSLEESNTYSVLPSFEVSTDLLPLYGEMLRDIEVQNQLVLLIRKELEQAKIRESRDVSSLMVIDPAYIAAYKTTPKRLFIVAGIVGIYTTMVIAFLLFLEFFTRHVRNSPEFLHASEAFRESFRLRKKK